MKKKFFLLGIILAALGVVVGIFALIGVYLGSGTRLLTISTGLGHAVRYTPIALIAAGVLLLAGIPMGLLCYAPSAKTLRRREERANAKAAKEAAREAAAEAASVQPAPVPEEVTPAPQETSPAPQEATPPAPPQEAVPQPQPTVMPVQEFVEPDFAPPAPPEAPAQGGMVCPACGTRNAPGSAFCTECGQRL